LTSKRASVDDYVASFEDARARGPVALEDFLPGPGDPARLAVLRELVRVDLELGWSQGKRQSLEAYLRAFPELEADADAVRDVAFEEYRARIAAGEEPDLKEYRERYGVEIAARPQDAQALGGRSADFLLRSHVGPTSLTVGGIPHGSTIHLQRRRFEAVAAPLTAIQSLLHVRLRFISFAAALYFGYHALLTTLNPNARVGLFLEGVHVSINWSVFLAYGAMTTLLWKKSHLSLPFLRGAELLTFGIAAFDLAAGLFDDLFTKRELVEPLAAGDHELFHFASSWCLPFFSLIIGYGILIPSGWRRCLLVVVGIASLPLMLSLAAGIREGALHKAFLESYLLQMVVWMALATAIALFGAVRLEALRREAEVSRRLGPYHLVRLIGAGGMGEVHVAEHALLRRPCAVKLIRPEQAGDPYLLQRFEREAQAQASLVHPSTAQVFDYGQAEDRTFYFVMEYLPGPNLDQLVKQAGPLDPSRVVHILRQICGALHEAHGRGLIHRDVKPGNIIVCELGGVEDVAKLLDFGLAHRHGPHGSRCYAMVGTPEYMAPEQTLEGSVPDARSDLYSLGATAYFLLTGRPPFQRPTIAMTLEAHRTEAPIGLGELRPELPESLSAAIMRCLAKDPRDRFATAHEFSHALG